MQFDGFLTWLQEVVWVVFVLSITFLFWLWRWRKFGFYWFKYLQICGRVATRFDGGKGSEGRGDRRVESIGSRNS